jgi:hypothetical protein
MTDPKITRRQIIKGAAAVGAIGALGLPSAAFADGGNGGDEGGRRIRWDLVNLPFPDVFAGGDDTASAEDGSTLTLTGSGTFRPGHPGQVTGGGIWHTTSSDVPGTGTYRVSDLVSWIRAPGSLPAVLVDHIGNAADALPGLAVLRIRYSDGLVGALVVSCNLASPASVDEGINATRGFVNFFHPAEPAFGQHSNRTVFHVLRKGEEG